MSSRPPRRSLILHFNVCNFKMCSGITVFKMTINHHFFWRRDLDLWLWVVNQHLVLWLPMCKPNHYNDVIMGTIASQITSPTIVCSTAYSGADQREHQSSASLAFVWGIHRDRWIPRTNGQKRRRCFHLMTSSCPRTIWEQTICIEDGRRWADTTVFMILCKTINIPDFHVSFGIFAFWNVYLSLIWTCMYVAYRSNNSMAKYLACSGNFSFSQVRKRNSVASRPLNAHWNRRIEL